VLTCLVAGIAAAQVGGGFQGPGILSNGVGDIGTRSGQQVNLRFYGTVTGVYDNGIQPVQVDSKGNLVTVNGLYGVEATGGVYGVHQWRTAQLGVDYRGTYRDFTNATAFNGSDQLLTLGYTYQKSRRLIFDFRQIGGTLSYGTGGLSNGVPTSVQDNVVVNATSLLFDSRYYLVQSTMDMTLAQTARTSYTMGGDWYDVLRTSSALAGVNGYNLRGSLQHRLSRSTTIGAMYVHTYFEFPKFFGNSTIDSGQGFLNATLGRRWTLSVRAGAFVAQVVGTQSVSLDPAVAALLGGQTTSYQAYSRVNAYPSGMASLSRQFKNTSLSIHYGRTVNPGNGVYLTSLSDDGAVSLSYTGIRKWNFGIQGGYSRLESIGLNLQPYAQFTGGAGVTYGLTRSFHVVARYDERHQEITLAGYRQTSYRAAFGLAFSPGNVPLSLW